MSSSPQHGNRRSTAICLSVSFYWMDVLVLDKTSDRHGNNWNRSSVRPNWNSKFGTRRNSNRSKVIQRHSRRQKWPPRLSQQRNEIRFLRPEFVLQQLLYPSDDNRGERKLTEGRCRLHKTGEKIHSNWNSRLVHFFLRFRTGNTKVMSCQDESNTWQILDPTHDPHRSAPKDLAPVHPSVKASLIYALPNWTSYNETTGEFKYRLMNQLQKES